MLYDIPDILYQFKIHKKADPTNLLSESLNINNIRHKFPTVDYILQNGYIGIFGIYETRQDDSFPEAQFHVANFIYYHKDRSASGDGVMLYVKSDISQRRRHDLEKLVDCSESGLDIIMIQMIMNSKERWVYMMGYKPPDIKTSFICVMTRLSHPKRQSRIIPYRSYKKFVEELFVIDLCISSQIMMHYIHNVDICFETFITYLCGIIDKHAPIKTKKVCQNNVPYMNNELRQLNYQRNMMRNIE